MTRAELRARDNGRLATVHPTLRDKVLLVLAEMDRLGHPMTVTDAFRTTSQQLALYAQGRTRPGRIVTNADGVTHKSNHQSGRAVDCAFIDEKNQPIWEGPWDTYAEVARAAGLNCGADWKNPDRPHVELP